MHVIGVDYTDGGDTGVAVLCRLLPNGVIHVLDEAKVQRVYMGAARARRLRQRGNIVVYSHQTGDGRRAYCWHRFTTRNTA